MAVNSSGKAKLEALLSLINSSAREAISEYEKAGDGVPSPDSNNAHPLDNSHDTLALKKAIRVLEGSCESLCTTLAQPGHTLINRTLSLYEPPCLRVAVEARIADILADHPNGLHATELSRKTSIEAGKLSRILRLLATRGCFREAAPGVFANNRISLAFRNDNNFRAVIACFADECTKAAAVLYETLIDKDYGASHGPDKSSFMYAKKDDIASGSFFDWFKVNPENGVRFDLGMVGFFDKTASLGVLRDFPWKSMANGTTVCDVGSGIGSFSMPLTKAHPHLRITLQDLPTQIERAQQSWLQNCPEAIAEKRVEFVPFDFFKGPPVKGQDIYYVRHIIHDWPTPLALDIMRNIRKAMNKNSRLILQEYILYHPYQSNESGQGDPQSGDTAPWPLVKNYGSGSIRTYLMDLNMLAMLNAQERTLQQFVELGAEAGLKLVKTWDLAETQLLEFQLDNSDV